MSREKILSAVRAGQPLRVALPVIPEFEISLGDPVRKFKQVLASLGGEAIDATNDEMIGLILKSRYSEARRVVSTLTDVRIGELPPHSLENVDVAIIGAHFAVAENGAVWVTEDLIQGRILPFITQHLVVVVKKSNVIPTLHQAYERIAATEYTFGSFIAGPSKTADIEQSLVLGVHGAKSTLVILTYDAL